MAYELTKKGQDSTYRYAINQPYQKQFRQDQPQQEPPQHDMDVDNAVRSMPNADKLTNFERWVGRALPRLGDEWKEHIGEPYQAWAEDRPAAQWLGRQAKWAGGWMGKALNVLDVGAEGIERTSGLIAQTLLAAQDDDLENFTSRLADAWYAGSLTYDVTNLPTFTRNEEGRINGMRLPDDLPTGAYLPQARRRITELVENEGYDRREALNIVRAEYYDDLGALALRAQLYDTYWHMLADPVNLIPAPVDLLQVQRAQIVSTKAIPEVLDSLLNIAKAENRLDDVAKITARIDELGSGKQFINTMDRAVLAMTGGTIETPSFMGKLAEVPVIGKAAKVFTLTPEARAREAIVTVANHLDTYLPRDSVENFMNTLTRVHNGSLGPEFGHAFVTLEGQMAQAVVSGVRAEVGKVYNEYLSLRRIFDLGDGRHLLDEMARLSDNTVPGVVEIFSKGDGKAFIQTLAAKHGDEAAEVLARLADNNIVDDIGKLSGSPYTDELFYLNARNAMLDATGKLSIAKFGLTEQGIATKMVSALKSAETMAFLRMNPGFAVRNFINNEFTMIARGVGLPVSSSKIDAFIDDIFGGIAPFRMNQAYSITSDATTALGKKMGAGDDVISSFLKGDVTVWDNIANKINGMEFPGVTKYLDMGYWGGKAEASAGRRAFYNGYVQGWQRHFWRPGKGFDRPVDVLGDATRLALGRDGMRAMEDAITDTWKPEELQAAMRTGNWNRAASTVVDDASRRVGYDIADVLGDARLADIRKDLPGVMESGPAGVRRYFEDLRTEMTKDLDDLLESNAQKRVEYFTNMAQAGPVGLALGHGDIFDELWGHAHVIHAMRMEDAVIPSSRLPDAMRSDAWKAISTQSREHYERFWRRASNGIDGFTKGADNAGYKIPAQYTKTYETVRDSWGKFFDLREKLHSEYFAIPSGQRPVGRWSEIQAELDDVYAGIVKMEATAAETLDNLVYDAFAQNNPELTEAFAAWRSQAREIRLEDRQMVIDFRREVRGMSPERRTEAFRAHWKARQNNQIRLHENYRAGVAAMQGNTTAQQAVIAAAPGASLRSQKISLANQYKIPTATKSGAPMDTVVVRTVNKYLRQVYEELGEEAQEAALRQFNSLDEIDLDLLQEVLEARRIYRGDPVPTVRSPFKGSAESVEVIPDIKDLLKDEMFPPLDIANDQLYQHGWEALDHMEASTLDIRKRPPLKFDNLDDAAKADVEKYLLMVEGQMKDARNAAVRFGEYRRDSALLNYNRRYEYNAMLDVVSPFSFWLTQSVQKWAIESVNRPQMLAYYLRIKKMMETMGAPGEGFPSRLSDSFRIKVPFMPEWMGDSIFVDPLGVALPISQWSSPFEQWHQQQFRIDGRAESVLQQWMEQGKYDSAKLQNAMENHEGNLWELALSTASSQMESGDGALDYISMLISPHAPLQWGWKLLQGRQEDIGPLAPVGRTMRIASAFLGVNRGDPSKGIIGNAREAIGLPAFDKWDDYRIKRMLSNMVATNELTLDEAMRAMVEGSGVIWDAAAEKAHIEYAGGSGVWAALKIAGIPLQTFPEGEQRQRALQEKFGAAMEARDNGDETALAEFFQEYPEYEARLALFKEPEEQMQTFLVDNLWSQWMEMPTVDQNIVKDVLGDEFQRNFLNKDTRNTDEIPIDTLQIWLKTMGGDPPGTLVQAIPIDYAPADTAWVAQQFYDIRKEAFPDYWELQGSYFDRGEGSPRREFLNEHPELRQYWAWRNDYFHRNPTILPYVDDDYELKYATEREERQAYAQPVTLTFTEWQYILGSSAANVVARGEIPPGTDEYLEEIAAQMGMSVDELVSDVMQSR